MFNDLFITNALLYQLSYTGNGVNYKAFSLLRQTARNENAGRLSKPEKQQRAIETLATTLDASLRQSVY